jgi:tetratricopeptide (TPR) repeat protein
MSSRFADLLGKHLQHAHTSVNRLATISGVPQRTISNWLNGYVRKPHQWQPIVQVAAALHLTEQEANELLDAVGHKSLNELRSTATSPADLSILSKYQGASPPNAPAPPFQAIPDLPTFVGRSMELEKIKHAILEEKHAAIYGLRGMGGVGKTALAAHLAYQVRNRFPDGILWARVDTSNSLSILASFADAYGKDVSEYRDVESRASVVRNLLATKNALIVLDNVETSTQIRALLPPTTGKCSVLITTRHDLTTVDGWTRITLEPFDAASKETILLFERYLGKTLTQTHRTVLLEIAALLGHLPLALAIAAGRLANEVSASKDPTRIQPIARKMLEDLRVSSSRLDTLTRDDTGVRASFEMSYSALKPDQQEFFSTLGIFSGEDFGTDAVAYLTHQTFAQANGKLQQLLSLCLVQEGRTTRWRLHPLLQDYAREKLAVSRHHTQIVERTLFMYQQAAEGKWTFERSLDEEIPNISFALHQASLLNIHQPLIETVRAIHPTLSAGAWNSLASTALEQAHLAAQAAGDHEAEIFFLSALADSQRGLGNSQNAREIFQSALQLARSVQQEKAMADIYMNMGKLEVELGFAKQARTYFEESLSLANKVNARLIIGKVKTNIGLIESWEGRYAEAESLYLESLEILREFQDAAAMAITLTNLGTIASLQENLERAEQYWQEGLSLARKANIRISIITLLANIGLLQLEHGKQTEAAKSYEEAIELAVEVHSPRMESAVRSLFGDILRKQGRYDAALSQLQQAKVLAYEIGDLERYAHTLRYLGELYTSVEQFEEADTSLQEALKTAQELQHEILVGDIFFSQAKLAYAREEQSASMQIAEKVLELYERLGDKQRAGILQKWMKTPDQPIDI